MSSERLEVRIPANLVGDLLEGIKWTRERESIVFALASHGTTKTRTIVLVRELMMLPAAEYVADPSHGAAWRGAAMIPVLNAALGAGLGIIAFHSHPHRGPVTLSFDDREGARRLLPTFANIIPGRPHGAVVMGEDYAAGMVLLPGPESYRTTVRVRLLGHSIRDLPSQEWPRRVFDGDVTFDRQALLTGVDGEARIREATIAVVGLSGGGGHVVQQLALTGIGRIVAIDDGRAKASHRARVVGLSRLDVALRRRKTTVMERLVGRTNRKVGFTGVPYLIPDQRAIDALKQADIVVGCVDNYHARADLQDLCARYVIPYVDIGLLIRPNERGGGVSIGGNVITAIPGRFCQWCIGFLSREKLDAETGGRPRSYFEGADGQAQVASMNGVLASAAVTEVLQLLTGFAPVSSEMTIKKYNGLTGTLEEWIVKPASNCHVCHGSLAGGDVLWRAA